MPFIVSFYCESERNGDWTSGVPAGKCLGTVGELDNMMENRRTKSERVRRRFLESVG